MSVRADSACCLQALERDVVASCSGAMAHVTVASSIQQHMGAQIKAEEQTCRSLPRMERVQAVAGRDDVEEQAWRQQMEDVCQHPGWPEVLVSMLHTLLGLKAG